MKLYLLLLSLCFWGITASAQQNFFVYLQTDNKQPFYVQVNDKVYSSSSSGYVMIPKLQNGAYNFSIGFPKNEWPQQTIPIAINNRDAGFLLKNFDSKGWGLFDLQTMNVIMPGAPAAKSEVSENKTDAFSNVLADVVNTPSLKEKEKEAEAPVKKEVEAPVKKEVEAPVKKEVEAPVKKEVVVVEVKENEIKREVPVSVVDDQIKKPDTIRADFIKVLSSNMDNDGRTMIILDQSTGNNDTVRIFIPHEKNIAATEVRTEIARTDTIQQIAQADVSEEKQTTDKKFINIELPNPNATTDTINIVTPVAVNTFDSTKKEVLKVPVTSGSPFNISMVNSDCKTFASDVDFLKARKKMVDESTDEKMITTARKILKSKCYSTEQIKNLSVLFLKDEGKYKFFDLAYPFVHDTQNFNTLEMQLKDEYYLDRFRAMIRH